MPTLCVQFSAALFFYFPVIKYARSYRKNNTNNSQNIPQNPFVHNDL